MFSYRVGDKGTHDPLLQSGDQIDVSQPIASFCYEPTIDCPWMYNKYQLRHSRFFQPSKPWMSLVSTRKKNKKFPYATS
jgi:hypothetical protein